MWGSVYWFPCQIISIFQDSVAVLTWQSGDRRWAIIIRGTQRKRNSLSIEARSVLF